MAIPRRSLAILLAAACGAALLLGRARDTAPPPSQDAAAPDSPAVTPLPAAPSPAGGALPPLPASLRGTDLDGGFSLDAEGRLLPTPGALRLFDYFLSASGEEPLETIEARITAEIEARLPPAAATDARELLARYLRYREALRGLDEPRVAGSGDLARRLQWVRELRREHFGAADAQALFGEEEELQRAAIDWLRVSRNLTLSDAERARQLEAIERALPENVRRAHDRAAAPLRALQEEEELRASGASEAEIRAMRERRFGAEAADRLAVLDRERAEWQRRLAAYRAERAVLLGGGAGESELEALRARHFQGAELARVRALDAEARPAR